MVESFNFSRLPLIYFGPGKASILPPLLSGYGRNILLVTGSSSFLASPGGQAIFENFKKEGLKVAHVSVKGEPSPDFVDSVVRDFRQKMPDVVVSVGGGSAIDAGKAISAMLTVEGNLKEYLEGVGIRQHPGTKIPFIAVPTTAGTGSEATKNAVISEVGKEGFKKSLRHENFVPDVAIVDPLLTVSCPPGITAASGMDCFTQLLEAYLSDRANVYTDALACEGIKTVISCLLRAYMNGDDAEARGGMSFAALTSGICLANAGLGAVHGFASSVGARWPIPHGIVCGTLMAEANAANVRALRKADSNHVALKKYALLGKMVTRDQNRTDDYYIDGFINYLRELTRQLEIPALGSFGVDSGDADAICAGTDVKNNPVRLSEEELKEILLSRI